jgi:hypothetical protein
LVTVRADDLKRASKSYPIGKYCTSGPNSNTYVGSIMRQMSAIIPPFAGTLIGLTSDPPETGTFAHQPPISTVFTCPSTTDCPDA